MWYTQQFSTNVCAVCGTEKHGKETKQRLNECAAIVDNFLCRLLSHQQRSVWESCSTSEGLEIKWNSRERRLSSAISFRKWLGMDLSIGIIILVAIFANVSCAKNIKINRELYDSKMNSKKVRILKSPGNSAKMKGSWTPSSATWKVLNLMAFIACMN